MKEKIFRVLGYILCALLIILCIVLIVMSSAFGSTKTVEIFGYNIFLVENDEIVTAPKGSAVIVKKCTATELEEGKLILYLNPNANDAPALGYVSELTGRDGVPYITVVDKNNEYEVAESKLIGRADYASLFWGKLLGFIKTPAGVAVIAVFPCAALILFEIIRAVAASRPEPEVIPKVKNSEEDKPHTGVKLSVDNDGKALYSKDRNLKKLPKDSDVLFNVAGIQKNKPKEQERSVTSIIPLTDRRPQEPSPKPQVPKKRGEVFEVTIPPELMEPSVGAAPETNDKPTRDDVIIDTPQFVNPTYKKMNQEIVPEKTAEIPTLSKSNQQTGAHRTDAFFAQSSPPQIGKQRRATPPSESEIPKLEKGAGKRSTQILASKNIDDLFSDDDDDRSFPGRVNSNPVDDILDSIKRRK